MDNLSNLVARFFNEKTNQIIYNASNGTFSVGPGPDDNKDQHWKLEPVNGKSSTYKLRNILTNNVIYNASNGSFGVGPDSTDNIDQHWKLESVNGQLSIFKLRNILTNNVIYNASNGTFGVGPDSTDNIDQHWKIRLTQIDLSTHLDSIDFSSDPFDKNKGKLESVWTVDIENPSNATITRTIAKTVTQESSFELALTQTLTLGASATFKAKVPFIGSAETTVSAELSLSAGQTWQSSKAEEYHFEETISVPPNTSIHAVGQLRWVENISIPYTISFWVSGKVKDTGVQLTTSQLKMFLIENGFTGIVINDQHNEKLLVSLDAIFSGSWGTETIIKSSTKTLS